MEENLIKVLYASNKMGILTIEEERVKRNDPHYLSSLHQKLKDCLHEIIDLAIKEGVDLDAM